MEGLCDETSPEMVKALRLWFECKGKVAIRDCIASYMDQFRIDVGQYSHKCMHITNRYINAKLRMKGKKVNFDELCVPKVKPWNRLSGIEDLRIR